VGKSAFKFYLKENGESKMPIKRKVCKIGTGYAVFLPKSWISLLEEKHGKVEAVTMEVNGQLIIKPILKEDETNKPQ
jgi:antitoxin component of MazEF toxin-antitoxin module